MKLSDCITILTEHNKWRRGEGRYGDGAMPLSPPCSAKELGHAIDYAIESLPAFYGTIKSQKQTKDAMVKKLLKQKLLLREVEDIFARCEALANTRFSPTQSFGSMYLPKGRCK